ncbi:MAG: hypothetical protein LBM25_00905 [Bacteroidales bacterium]|jgi:hypothetical protein|nr:hypothetical protein [Bacteroidales bacterium]
MELRNLLDLSNVATNKIEERFKEIADLLFKEYCIKKGKDQYKFLEIEFYYYTKGFEDIITYPRNAKSGKWFFHNSGVDITFESDITKHYFGGILIRSLLKNDENVIKGPLNCLDSLFDIIDAFELEKKDLPLIVKNENEKLPVIATTRYIGSKYDSFPKVKEEYRFYIKHPKWENITTTKYRARPW